MGQMWRLAAATFALLAPAGAYFTRDDIDSTRHHSRNNEGLHHLLRRDTTDELGRGFQPLSVGTLAEQESLDSEAARRTTKNSLGEALSRRQALAVARTAITHTAEAETTTAAAAAATTATVTAATVTVTATPTVLATTLAATGTATVTEAATVTVTVTAAATAVSTTLAATVTTEAVAGTLTTAAAATTAAASTTAAALTATTSAATATTAAAAAAATVTTAAPLATTVAGAAAAGTAEAEAVITTTLAGASTTLAEDGTTTADTGFLMQHVLLVGILLFSAVLAGAYYRQTSEKQEAAKKKPFSWAARAIALPLTFKFMFNSLPYTGYMFSGCWYSSWNGVGAAMSCAPMCIPQSMEFLGLSAPMEGAGLRVSAIGMLSTAVSGISLAFLFGDTGCSMIFLHMCCWELVAAILTGVAWWKGEGGGLMGVLNG